MLVRKLTVGAAQRDPTLRSQVHYYYYHQNMFVYYIYIYSIEDLWGPPTVLRFARTLHWDLRNRTIATIITTAITVTIIITMITYIVILLC